LVKKLIDGVHPSLPEDTALALETLLLQYQDVFSQSAVDWATPPGHSDYNSAGTSSRMSKRLPNTSTTCGLKA